MPALAVCSPLVVAQPAGDIDFANPADESRVVIKATVQKGQISSTFGGWKHRKSRRR